MKIKYKIKNLDFTIGDKVKVNFNKEGCIELLKKYTLPTDERMTEEFIILDLNSTWHTELKLPAVKVNNDLHSWLIPKELLIKCI